MRGHFNVLTDEQVETFNKRFTFEKTSGGVVVKAASYNRSIFHPANASFQSIAVHEGRKITVRISVQALDLWMNDDEIRSRNTLVDIQNAINKAITTDGTNEISVARKYMH